MKPGGLGLNLYERWPFSTLNSGLRDETRTPAGPGSRLVRFQYPQLGPTR